MSEKLHENIGELTKKCLDEIFEGDYTFLTDDEEYTEEYHYPQLKSNSKKLHIVQNIK